MLSTSYLPVLVPTIDNLFLDYYIFSIYYDRHYCLKSGNIPKTTGGQIHLAYYIHLDYYIFLICYDRRYCNIHKTTGGQIHLNSTTVL